MTPCREVLRISGHDTITGNEIDERSLRNCCSCSLKKRSCKQCVLEAQMKLLSQGGRLNLGARTGSLCAEGVNTEAYIGMESFLSCAEDCVKWAYSNGLLMLQAPKLGKLFIENGDRIPNSSSCDGAKFFVGWKSNISDAIHCAVVPSPDVVIAPVTLFPHPFPLRRFEEARELAPSFGSLIDRISCCEEWIFEALEPLCKIDSFMDAQMQILRRVYLQSGNGESGKSPRCLISDIRAHLLRVDYMLDGNKLACEDPESWYGDKSFPLKLVEFNTIAASFAGLSEKTMRWHRKISRRILSTERYESFAGDEESGSEDTGTCISGEEQLNADCCSTVNNPACEIGRGIALAHKAYIRRQYGHRHRNEDGVFVNSQMKYPRHWSVGKIMLCVVHEKAERNIFDQMCTLDYAEEHAGATVFRISLQLLVSMWEERRLLLRLPSGALAPLNCIETTEVLPAGHLAIRLSLQPCCKKCVFNLDINKFVSVVEHDASLCRCLSEVSVIYFRSCYIPEHFTSVKDWRMREILEVSEAVKIPSIPAQLVGCKKIQQMLSPGSIDFTCSVLGVNDMDIHERQASDTHEVLKKKNCVPHNALLRRFLASYDEGVVEKLWSVLQMEICPGDFPLQMIDEELFQEGNVKISYTSQNAIQTILADAVQNPSKYILKPQREGGGNNLHGQELSDRLADHIRGKKFLSDHVLVKKFSPPSVPGIILREVDSVASATENTQAGNVSSFVQGNLVPTVAELGVYSMTVIEPENYSDPLCDMSGDAYCKGDVSCHVIANAYCGSLLRVKPTSSNEGGVAAGFGALSSPLLIDGPGEGHAAALLYNVLRCMEKKSC